MCLRIICGIRRVNRVKKSLISERCSCELSILERMKRNMLKWLRHVERLWEERLVKKVCFATVEGNRGRRRLQRRWRDEGMS